MRRSSSHHYVRRVPLKFRIAQLVMNAVALIALGGGMVAYFRGMMLFNPEQFNIFV